jgi:hypothetical protein
LKKKKKKKKKEKKMVRTWLGNLKLHPDRDLD